MMITARDMIKAFAKLIQGEYFWSSGRFHLHTPGRGQTSLNVFTVDRSYENIGSSPSSYSSRLMLNKIASQRPRQSWSRMPSSGIHSSENPYIFRICGRYGESGGQNRNRAVRFQVGSSP